MASAIATQKETGFGTTDRKDLWWAGPLGTFLGLLAFLIYANVIIFFVPGYFEIRQDRADFFKAENPAVAPYLAPFSAPLMYDAVVFVFLLGWDALYAFWWPTDRGGHLFAGGSHQFGMGLGTLLMIVNVVLLAGFTLGCNSLRHLAGGRLNCFSCPNNYSKTN